MSDPSKIEAFIKSNGSITCYEAVTMLNVWNLRSRASEMGLHSEMIPVTRADGVNTRVARYTRA